MYRYEQIDQHVAHLIATGAIRPGGRVPSVRRLSRQFDVSTNTVLQALDRLEARGAIEARPRSGFFACHPPVERDRLPHPTRGDRAARQVVGDRLLGFIRAMRGDHFLPLGAACPSPALLPGERLARVTGQVARRLGARLLPYDALPGYPLLRREIARRLSTAGCAVLADEVITTVGAVEAIHLALRAVTVPGDTIAVDSPGYFGVLQLAAELRLRVIEVPVDPVTGISVDEVGRVLARRRIAALVTVASFSNPLGALAPPDRKRALVDVCRAGQTPIIESDVYGELAFDDRRPLPLKAFDRGGWVLHCSSFSKTLAPSYRVGWICPGRFFAAVEASKFAHTVATSTLAQAAIAELLVSGGYDRHLRRLRRQLADQVARARALVIEHFPEGTRVSAPRGGFVLWVEMPASSPDAIEVQRRALRDGIGIAPGPMFSTGSAFDRCLRLSCGYPITPSIARGIARLGQLAAT